jgi:hypothetical protein
MKVSCLALAAGCVALLSFGATPAAATAFCKVKTEVCSEASRYPSGAEYHWHLQKEETVQTGFVSCTASVLVDVLLEPGTPLLNEVSDTTYAGCTSFLGECGEEVVHLPLKSEAEVSTSTIKITREGGELEWHVVCGSALCVYGAKKVDFLIKGGEPATAVAKEQPLTLKEGPGPTCGLKPTFNASYVIDEVTVSGKTTKNPPLFLTK